MLAALIGNSIYPLGKEALELEIQKQVQSLGLWFPHKPPDLSFIRTLESVSLTLPKAHEMMHILAPYVKGKHFTCDELRRKLSLTKVFFFAACL